MTAEELEQNLSGILDALPPTTAVEHLKVCIDWLSKREDAEENERRARPIAVVVNNLWKFVGLRCLEIEAPCMQFGCLYRFTAALPALS